MKRISAKVREEAADICAAMASGVCGAMKWNDCNVFWAMSHLGYDHVTDYPIRNLIYDAISETENRYGYGSPERYAEAESLLRCGWVP